MKFKIKYTTEAQAAEIVGLCEAGHEDAIVAFGRDVAHNAIGRGFVYGAILMVGEYAAICAIDLLWHKYKVKKELAKTEKNKEQ